MPRVLLPPAGGFPPVQFPSQDVGIVNKPGNRSVSPQMVVWKGWSAFYDPNLVALDCVKQFDLRSLVIWDSFLTEPTYYPFDPLLFNLDEGHSSTPVSQ